MDFNLDWFKLRSMLAVALAAAVIYAVAVGLEARAVADSTAPQTQESVAPSAPGAHLDRSGKKRVGKASFYARRFSGKKMADGKIMDPANNNAASKTLPLGTVAKVTNLETGKSAVVTIEDRGPYVDGRIVDLSPSTAQRIGIKRSEGVAKVAVAPITVPLADGGVKSGVGADSKLADNRPGYKTADH
jgi:rare lipoprotein A